MFGVIERSVNSGGRVEYHDDGLKFVPLHEKLSLGPGQHNRFHLQAGDQPLGLPRSHPGTSAYFGGLPTVGFCCNLHIINQ